MDRFIRSTYWTSQQESAVSRVLSLAGKTMGTCTNPRLTKREYIALADYLAEVDRKAKKYDFDNDRWA